MNYFKGWSWQSVYNSFKSPFSTLLGTVDQLHLDLRVLGSRKRQLSPAPWVLVSQRLGPNQQQVSWVKRLLPPESCMLWLLQVKLSTCVSAFLSHVYCNLCKLLTQILGRICCCLATQLCPTLCSPMDNSPSGSSVHGILQVRIRVGCHFLLQGIFATQGLNSHLLPW